MFLIANIVTTSVALVPSSDALVTTGLQVQAVETRAEILQADLCETLLRQQREHLRQQKTGLIFCTSLKRRKTIRNKQFMILLAI